MPVFNRSIAAACLAVLAACTPAPAPTGSATPAAPASPPATAPVETETVIARYDCPGAGRIDLIRDGRHARLTMTDGRIVHIGAIQGSRPPIWSEVGLRFIVDGDFIEISEDSGRAFACTALPEGEPDGASPAD